MCCRKVRDDWKGHRAYDRKVPDAVRSGLSDGPFYTVMSTVFPDLCPVNGPLASALCYCVMLLALPSGVDAVQSGVSHPGVGMSMFFQDYV